MFTRSSKRRANIELAHTPFASSVYTIQQTSSKLPANVFKIHVLIARRLLDVCWTFAGSWICCILSSRPIGTPPPGSNVGLGLGSLPTADHVLYRPSNYNPPALLISMLITIERPASCSMFARSCKHPITKLIWWPILSSYFLSQCLKVLYLPMISNQAWRLKHGSVCSTCKTHRRSQSWNKHFLTPLMLIVSLHLYNTVVKRIYIINSRRWWK